MSTPLFSRTLSLGSAIPNGALTGQDLSTFGAITFDDLTDVATEDMLIEQVIYSTKAFGAFNNDNPQILLGIDDNAGHIAPIRMEELDIGSSTQYAQGVVDLKLSLPVGYKLVVAHSMKNAGGGSYAALSIVATGAIVR